MLTKSVTSTSLAAKMAIQTNTSDYSRYFSLSQKIFLVKMSSEHNSDIYESLSGIITSSDMNSIELRINHSGADAFIEEVGKTTYKLTSEAFASGIQVLADLISVAGNIFKFQMHGTLEMFQRRSVSRVELSAPVFHLRRNFQLSFYKKEWNRVMDHLRNNRELPGLVLKETNINLSAGGLGLTIDSNDLATPLSMFFIKLDEGLPVCAIAEKVWEKSGDDGLCCGFRFIHILKADQERINNYTSDIIRKNGGTSIDYKRNWELVDKMFTDIRKPA